MFSLNVAAQENKPALMDLIHQVQQYLDSAAKRKVDARYIEVPAKPWRVILRYKETAFDVDYSNSAGDPAAGDGVDWQLGFKPPTSPSVGIWAGYRGTGVSFAKSLRKKEGATLSFSTTGAMYGFNFRMRKFEMDEASLTATIYEGDKVEQLDYIGRTGAPDGIPLSQWILRVQRAPLLTGCRLQPVRHPASLCRLVPCWCYVVYVLFQLL